MAAFNIKDITDKFKTVPTDLVGIDIGVTSIKAVRMKKSGEKITILGADVLPAVKQAAAPAEGAPLPPPEPVELPAKIRGKYAAITITAPDAVVKLLNFPGAFDQAAEDKVVGNIGVDNPDNYRIGYKLISEGHGKTESKVLALAVPESDASRGPMIFPVGLPAPFSLEVSGLSVLTSFMNNPVFAQSESTLGVMDFGTSISTFGLFHKGVLALIRRFDFGTGMVVDKVQEMLGVDRETAQGIINDGAFDISQAVTEVVEPLVKQMIVSKDFVERRENCHVTKMFMSGGVVISKNLMEEFKLALGLEIDTWNPFEGYEVAPNAIAPELAGKEWRFAAAVGACLGTFEET